MMAQNILDLLMLVMLQAVLGFDNLLYISLESQRVDEDKQPMVRKWGILGAIGLRIGLLYLIIHLVSKLQSTFLHIDWGFFEASFNGHSLIVLAGGIFITFTAAKEIKHMFHLEDDEKEKKPLASIPKTIILIMLMNLVFSFDSILAAMQMTEVFWVMATAILISGLVMWKLSDTVSTFLKKNREYEVIGLVILMLVGFMLLMDGAHLSHMSFFGNEIHQMSSTNFYFVVIVLFVSQIIEGKQDKKYGK